MFNSMIFPVYHNVQLNVISCRLFDWVGQHIVSYLTDQQSLVRRFFYCQKIIFYWKVQKRFLRFSRKSEVSFFETKVTQIFLKNLNFFENNLSQIFLGNVRYLFLDISNKKYFSGSKKTRYTRSSISPDINEFIHTSLYLSYVPLNSPQFV